MQGYDYKLHIGDELFDGMRKDADMVLQKLLKTMMEKNSLEGKVTIGIDVSLEQKFILNCDPDIEGETRRIFTPKFSHKVGSVMQIKNEAKGDRNCDGTELVLDKEREEYVLRPIANTEQRSIFDSDFQCQSHEAEGNEQEATGSNAIEANDIPMLPELDNDEGGVIDGEYREVDATESGVEEIEPGDGLEDITDEILGGEEPEDGWDDDYNYEEPEDEE